MKAPLRGEFRGFLSGHELVLLDQDRYLKWDCFTGQERWLTPAGLKPVIYTRPDQAVPRIRMGLVATQALLRVTPSVRLAALFGRLPGEANAALHVWDLAEGKRVGTIPGLSEAPSRVDFSPNGHYAVIDDPADQAKSMRVWDLHLGRFTNRLSVPRGLSLSREHPMAQRSFNPDGSLLASSVVASEGTSSLMRLCVWDSAGDILATLPYGGYDWSSDGQRLITYDGCPNPQFWASFTRGIRCWEVARPPLSYDLAQAIKSLSLNRDGDRLAVNQWVCTVLGGGRGAELAAWEDNEQGLVPQFVGKDQRWAVKPIYHHDSVNGWQARPRPDRPLFAAGLLGLLGSELSPWLVRSAFYPRPFEAFPKKAHTTELWQLAPAARKLDLPDADYSAQVQMVDDIIKNSDKPNGRLNSRWTSARTATFNSVSTSGWAFSPVAPLLVRQAMVEMYEVCQPWQQREGTAFPAPVLELWNYQEGKRLAARNEHGTAFQFSPDGRRIAMGRNDKLEIWDTATFQMERQFTGSFANQKPTFSPDGRHLLLLNAHGVAKPGDPDAALRAILCDVETGQEVQFGKFKGSELRAFAVSPDLKLAATGGDDRMLHLWDVASGRELARWPGHDGGVTALLFSKDGQTLFSGSQDGALKLWHLPTIHKELFELALEW